MYTGVLLSTSMKCVEGFLGKAPRGSPCELLICRDRERKTTAATKMRTSRGEHGRLTTTFISITPFSLATDANDEACYQEKRRVEVREQRERS